jgi:hypothetical protein
VVSLIVTGKCDDVIYGATVFSDTPVGGRPDTGCSGFSGGVEKELASLHMDDSGSGVCDDVPARNCA